MKILMILPEFEEGGVERHVLWLSTELSALGHSVWIATAGGRLETMLPPEIRVLHLPVHRKNPATAGFCALRLAALCRTEGIDLLHAHSRVPAWIAWWTSRISGKPWVFTAHACYSRNAGLFPIRFSDGAICVSETVRAHLKGLFPSNSLVIPNGIPEMEERWLPQNKGNEYRFLFVGRLTRLKGLHVLLEAFAMLKEGTWVLNILGDGPQRQELEEMVKSLDLVGKVRFHGFRDDVGRWMAEADCFLFPSLDEGMPLTLMQAIRVGIPVLASRIEPVVELVGRDDVLLPAGDVSAWSNRLAEVLNGDWLPPCFDPDLVPSARQMAQRTLEFLSDVSGL